MTMQQEICEKCKHCLSCMCGDEFEDCYLKHPDLKRDIVHVVFTPTEEDYEETLNQTF